MRDSASASTERWEKGSEDDEWTTEDIVEELTPTPDEILRDNADMYEEKEADYGASWKLAGKTIAMWSEFLEIDDLDPQDEDVMISIGLYFQRMHKLTRSYNLEFGSGDPNNEPVAESHGDESTYAGIHTHHSHAQDVESGE